MALDVALLLCSCTTVSDIFTLKKDTAKQHCNNVGLNVVEGIQIHSSKSKHSNVITHSTAARKMGKYTITSYLSR